MKRFVILPVLAIIFCAGKSNAQQSPCKAQVDSVKALYYFVLEKYDASITKQTELEKQLNARSGEFSQLKLEVESMLKQKKGIAGRAGTGKRIN